MYGHESLLESKNKFFNHQLDEIKLDFKKNLKSKLESYIVQPLTR
jgi:hypothetical protein